MQYMKGASLQCMVDEVLLHMVHAKFASGGMHGGYSIAVRGACRVWKWWRAWWMQFCCAWCMQSLLVVACMVDAAMACMEVAVHWECSMQSLQAESMLVNTYHEFHQINHIWFSSQPVCLSIRPDVAAEVILRPQQMTLDKCSNTQMNIPPYSLFNAKFFQKLHFQN